MCPDKTWKRRERETAKQLGGERTWWLPVDVRGSFGDVRAAVECKVRKYVAGWFKDMVSQAQINAAPGEFPCVRLMEKNRRKSYIIADWDDFREWFGEPPAQEEAA